MASGPGSNYEDGWYQLPARPTERVGGAAWVVNNPGCGAQRPGPERLCGLAFSWITADIASAEISIRP